MVQLICENLVNFGCALWGGKLHEGKGAIRSISFSFQSWKILLTAKDRESSDVKQNGTLEQTLENPLSSQVAVAATFDLRQLAYLGSLIESCRKQYLRIAGSVEYS